MPHFSKLFSAFIQVKSRGFFGTLQCYQNDSAPHVVWLRVVNPQVHLVEAYALIISFGRNNSSIITEYTEGIVIVALPIITAKLFCCGSIQSVSAY